MKQWNDAILQLGIEIDQQISARHQIKLGERRVLDDVVLREDAHLAQFLDHAIGVAFADEPARQPFRRHFGFDVGAIAADAGGGEGASVDVGRKNLDMGRRVLLCDVLAQQDCD